MTPEKDDYGELEKIFEGKGEKEIPDSWGAPFDGDSLESIFDDRPAELDTGTSAGSPAPSIASPDAPAVPDIGIDIDTDTGVDTGDDTDDGPDPGGDDTGDAA